MVKRKDSPNHHKGKRTDYELIDGVYHIAPLYQERFDTVNLRKAGIEAMLAAVTKEATKSLEELAKVTSQIWADICDDIGLEKTTPWKFTNGTVSKIEK